MLDTKRVLLLHKDLPCLLIEYDPRLGNPVVTNPVTRTTTRVEWANGMKILAVGDMVAQIEVPKDSNNWLRVFRTSNRRLIAEATSSNNVWFLGDTLSNDPRAKGEVLQ